MHAFGEIAVIEINSKRKIRNKLENRGRTCLYLGRAANHITGVGRYLNLETNRIILSREITWLGKMYGDWKGIDNRVVLDDHTEEADDDDYSVQYLEQISNPTTIEPTATLPTAVPMPVPTHHDDDPDTSIDDDSKIISIISPPSKRLMNEIRKLTGFYNPTANRIFKQATDNDDNDDNNILAKVSDEGNSDKNREHSDNDNNNNINIMDTMP
jgi:hypothetical protein